MILFLGMNTVYFFKVLKTIDFFGVSVTFPVWVLIMSFMSNVTHA